MKNGASYCAMRKVTSSGTAAAWAAPQRQRAARRARPVGLGRASPRLLGQCGGDLAEPAVMVDVAPER